MVEEDLRWLSYVGVPLVSRLLRGNLCVQWIKTDKLELGREAACDLAALPALESATTTMCGRLNGGFFYFLLSHIIYHCSLSSLRRGKSVKLEEQPPRRGGGRRSNMRNGLSKEERETQEGGADGRWRGRRTASLISPVQHLQL